jgi:hypothetical protein
MESRTVMVVWRLLQVAKVNANGTLDVSYSLTRTLSKEVLQTRIYPASFGTSAHQRSPDEPTWPSLCRRIIEARAKTFHNSSSMSGGARELEDVGHMKCSLKASFSNHPFLLIMYKNIFLRRMDVSPGGD